MTSYSKERLLPYTPQQLFDLVADVNTYPEFLPWCQGAHVLVQEPTFLTADLIIGTRWITGSFSSLVSLKPHEHIYITSSEDGLLRQKPLKPLLSHLEAKWHFKEHQHTFCELCFCIEFQFSSSLYQSMMTHFFQNAMASVMTSFEERARHLYGTSPVSFFSG